MEQCLIARNLLFMKMHELPKSRMKAGIISVKLKRKQKYKNYHWREYISIPKVKEALRILKSLGHKYYQFIKESDLQEYENRCNAMDDQEDENLIVADDYLKINEPRDLKVDNDVDLIEKETEEFLTNDSVAKFQFDYDSNTCFTNNVPEIGILGTVINVFP